MGASRHGNCSNFTEPGQSAISDVTVFTDGTLILQNRWQSYRSIRSMTAPASIDFTEVGSRWPV
jgi:hypothetical protein